MCKINIWLFIIKFGAVNPALYYYSLICAVKHTSTVFAWSKWSGTGSQTCCDWVKTYIFVQNLISEDIHVCTFIVQFDNDVCRLPKIKPCIFDRMSHIPKRILTLESISQKMLHDIRGGDHLTPPLDFLCNSSVWLEIL